MRKSIIFSIIFTFVLVGTSLAEVPQVINYQGLLADSTGNPLIVDSQLVFFSIYDSSVGGTQLWSSGPRHVYPQDGLFNYALGSNVPLPDDLFTDTLRYLGITIGFDPESLPRTRLETSPYAYHALRADTALNSAQSVGVTQSFDGGGTIFTNFLAVVEMIDSIDCPSSGYVMASVTGGLGCLHTVGDDDVVFLLITDSTNTITDDQDAVSWSMNTSLPSGLYTTIVHVQKVYPVEEGWNKYYVLSSHADGIGGTDNCGTSDLTFSLLFIPSTFGTVEVGTKSNSGPQLISPAQNK